MRTHRGVGDHFLDAFSLAPWECGFHPLQVFPVPLGRVRGACSLLRAGIGLTLGSWEPSGGRAGCACENPRYRLFCSWCPV